MTFFTADTHFGHENIVRYCGRPFKNAHQMDKTIITNYNAVVGKDDTCYFIGDFTMSANKEQIHRWLNALNGKKVLILGNHDRLKPFAYVELGFASVHTSLSVRIDDRFNVVCTHDPAPACGTDHNFRWLVGHVHGLFKHLDAGRVTNVGVDVWDFTPVSEAQLLDYWKELLV